MAVNSFLRVCLYLMAGLVVSLFIHCRVCDWLLIAAFLGLVGAEMWKNHSLVGTRRLAYYACTALLALAGVLLAYQAQASLVAK